MIEARIIQWEQSGEDELQFEANLNNFERKLVHEVMLVRLMCELDHSM